MALVNAPVAGAAGRRTGSRQTSTAGNAAIETALVLPVLLIVLIGIFQFSSILYTRQISTYILNEGGMKLSGSSNVLDGAGVTFFNTGGRKTSFGDVDFRGASTGSPTAPSSGPFAGVLFMQSRSSASVKSGVKFKVAGTVSTKFDGVIYFPNHAIEYSGTSDQALRCVKMIGRTVTFNGTSTAVIPPSCVSDAVQIRRARLALRA